MKARDPNELAIERAMPGLQCSHVRVESGGSGVVLTVRGTPGALLASGMLTQAHLDAIPKCGVSELRRRTREKRGIPWPADVRRLKDGRLQVYRWWFDDNDEDDDPRKLIELWGLTIPKPAEPAPERRDSPVDGLQWRKRAVGRFQRLVHWAVSGNVIVVNFHAARGAT